MRQYFLTGMAALMCCGLFTGCSHDSALEDSRQAVQESYQKTYEDAFKARFGNPGSTQDWGFGSTKQARTRAAVASPSVSYVGPTFNAQMATAATKTGYVILNNLVSYDALAYMEDYRSWDGTGWNDSYYAVNASVVHNNLSDEYLAHIYDVIIDKIPEHINNLDKIASPDYCITTKGGPVTLTPIYHFSNSGDLISYYYYPVGTNPDVKTLPKYQIGNMADPNECNSNDRAFNHNTYSLVFVDGNNVSYDFPAGYEIHFLIANTWIGRGSRNVYDGGGYDGMPISEKTVIDNPEYYGDGNLNTGIHGSAIDSWKNQDVAADAPHIAVFKIGDKNYIGFEDWTDMDLNDVIFEVTGTDGGEEITVEEDWEELRVIAEDLTVDESTDFDFNDVVFDVRRYTAGPKTGIVEIILRAAGGTLPLYVDGHEVHEAFGAEVYEMVNTNALGRGLAGKNANPVTIEIPAGHYAGSTIGEIANSIDVYVVKDGVECHLSAPVGGIASKIGVKCDYEWCQERQDLDDLYSLEDGTSLFSSWVQEILPADDWYRYAKEKIDEYRAAIK